MALKQPKDDASYAEWDKWHNDLHFAAFIKPLLKPVKARPQENS